MKNWSVSVVIPTFNRAEHIGRTLESVLAQTVPADEVIVVDDGSTDRTAEVLAEFGRRVRVLHIENTRVGPSGPRNVGIGAARSQYITLVDSDDVLLPNVIERHRELFVERPDLGMVFHRTLVSRATPEGDSPPVPRERLQILEDCKRPIGGDRYWIPAAAAYSAYCRGNYITTATGTTFLRSLWETVGGFDDSGALRTSNDRDFFFRILPLRPVGYIDAPLHVYYHHQSNISAANLDNQFKPHHYLNMLRVLRRQLGVAASTADRRALRESIKAILLDLAYGYRRAHQYREAFSTYWTALRYRARQRATISGLLKVPAAWLLDRVRHRDQTAHSRNVSTAQSKL